MRVIVPLLLAAVLAACPGPTDPGGGDGGYGPYEPTSFTAPSTTPVNNSLLVTVTGEAFATEGLGFPPPATGGELYFLDGWEVTFEHVVVTVGRVTVSENPALDPNDQSRTGAVVAEAVGPWAVDLAVPGPLTAKEGNGTAIALTRLVNQNRKAGTPAFSSSDRYAFGYELIAPAGRVQRVNLDAEASAALDTMAADGTAVWMKGTATFKGTACRQTVAGYDFARFPQSVGFTLSFKTPTRYLNCDNPELSGADRGVQTQAGAETVAQVTFHLDHPFWESLEEDAPLRFDALAAGSTSAAAPGPASASITITSLQGKDFQAIKDAQQTAVPWRTCGPTLAGERTTGTVTYDPAGVPVNPSGGAAGLKDLVDFMAYNLSTFGHFNNDGLCFPQRQFPAPP